MLYDVNKDQLDGAMAVINTHLEKLHSLDLLYGQQPQTVKAKYENLTPKPINRPMAHHFSFILIECSCGLFLAASVCVLFSLLWVVDPRTRSWAFSTMVYLELPPDDSQRNQRNLFL